MRARAAWLALGVLLSGCGQSMGEPVQESGGCGLIPGAGEGVWIVESAAQPWALGLGVAFAALLGVVITLVLLREGAGSSLKKVLIVIGMLTALSFVDQVPYTTIDTTTLEVTHVTRRGIWRMETGRETMRLDPKRARFVMGMFQQGKRKGPGLALHTGTHRIKVCPPWAGSERGEAERLAKGFNARALNPLRAKDAASK